MSATTTCMSSRLRLPVGHQDNVGQPEFMGKPPTNGDDSPLAKRSKRIQKPGHGLRRLENGDGSGHQIFHCSISGSVSTPSMTAKSSHKNGRKRPKRAPSIMMSAEPKTLPCKWRRLDSDREAISDDMHLVPDSDLGTLTSLCCEDTDDVTDTNEKHQDMVCCPHFHEVISQKTTMHHNERKSHTDNVDIRNSRPDNNITSQLHLKFPPDLNLTKQSGIVAFRKRRRPTSVERREKRIASQLKRPEQDSIANDIILSSKSSASSDETINLIHCDIASTSPANENRFDPEGEEDDHGDFRCFFQHEICQDPRVDYSRGQVIPVADGITDQSSVTNRWLSFKSTPWEHSDKDTGDISSLWFSSSLTTENNDNIGLSSQLPSSSSSSLLQSTRATKKGKAKTVTVPPLRNAYLKKLKAMSGFLLLFQEDGTILYASANVSEHMGCNQTDVIGRPIDAFVHPSDAQELQRRMASTSLSHTDGRSPTWSKQKALRIGMMCELECHRGRTHSGYTMFQWDAMIELVLDHSGRPTRRLVSVCRPVASLPILEIRQDTQMFTSIHNLGFHFLHCDSRVTKLMGYEPNDLIGQSAYLYHCPKDLDICKTCHIKLLRDGTSRSACYRFLSRTGSWVWLVTYASIRLNSRQRPHYIVCHNCLISEKEAEELLSKERREYRKMKLWDFDTKLNFSMDLNEVDITSRNCKSFTPVSLREGFSFCGTDGGFHSKWSTGRGSKQHLRSLLTTQLSCGASKNLSNTNISSLKDCHINHFIRKSRGRNSYYAHNEDCQTSIKSLREDKSCINLIQNHSLEEESVAKPTISTEDMEECIPSEINDNSNSQGCIKLVVFDSQSLSSVKFDPKELSTAVIEPRTSFMYLMSNLYSNEFQDDGSQSLSQDHNGHSPQETSIDVLPYLSHSNVHNSISNPKTIPNDQEAYQVTLKDTTFLSEMSTNGGEIEDHDTTLSFYQDPYAYENPSLNPCSSDEENTMMGVITDDTPLSENTLGDSDMDVDYRSNFFTNSFSTDIFPELDLNSEYSFLPSDNFPNEKHKVNIEASHDFNTSDNLIAANSTQTLSEISTDLDIESDSATSSYISSPVSENFQGMGDIDNMQFEQSMQLLSSSHHQEPAGQIQSNDQSSNDVTQMSIDEQVRHSPNKEFMEVESDYFFYEDSPVSQINSSQSTNITFNPSPPANAEINSVLKLSKDFPSVMNGKSVGCRSLLRTLLKRDGREISDVSNPSNPSLQSLFEEKRELEDENSISLGKIVNPKESQLNTNVSTFDNFLNSHLRQKVSKELPLPKSVTSSRHSTRSSSPSQSPIFEGEIFPKERESCSSSQSGDDLPEDLVDLAMDYGTFLDSHHAQELISELGKLEWAEKHKCRQKELVEENAKRSSQLLPIPGISPKSQMANQNGLSKQQRQQRCQTTEKSNMTSLPVQNVHSHISIIRKTLDKCNSLSLSRSQSAKMSLLREAVTSPNVDKLIEKLPLGKTPLETQIERNRTTQCNSKTNQLPQTFKSNSHSSKGISPVKYSSAKSLHSRESLLSVHSNDCSHIKSSESSHLVSSPNSVTQTLPGIQTSATSHNSFHVQISIPSAKQRRGSVSRGNPNATSPIKNLHSKQGTSSSEPVSVMVMRKEYHRSRRSKNVATQTDSRPDEIYPIPEPCSTDIIITPSVYMTRLLSPSSHNASTCSTQSSPQHENNNLSIILKSPSNSSNLEPEISTGSPSSSLSPVSLSDPDLQLETRCSSLEQPGRQPNKPSPSSLPFLQMLLTGELNKDRYQLIDQQLLANEKSGSGTSFSNLD